MAMSLMKGDVRRLHRILGELLSQSEADGCIISDQAGYVLEQVGIGAHDPQLLSALGAGVFAATKELARLLGEDEFSMVLHQGEKRSILICAASDDALLGVIFSSTASIGLVKLYTPTAASSIRTVLEDAKRNNHRVFSETQSFVLTGSDNVFGVSQ